jgi:hypothetical protein
VEINPGAYVLLMDVARQVADPKTQSGAWPSDSRAALLRYAWLKGSRVPGEARLLFGLKQIIPDVHQLEELRAGLEENHNQVSRSFPDATNDDYYVPEVLRNLAMGGRD